MEGLHQIRGLRDVAHEDASDEAATAQDQLLGGVFLWLGELDEFIILERLRDSHGCELDAHDLQLGCELGAVISGIEIALRDMVGEDFSVLPKGRDKAVNLAAMLGAFAHGIDIRIIHGAHMVVDDNSAPDGKPSAKADSALGRIPAAIISMSEASAEPSLN